MALSAGSRERWSFGFSSSPAAWPPVTLWTSSHLGAVGRLLQSRLQSICITARLVLQMFELPGVEAGTAGHVATAHQGPGPNPTDGMDRLLLSHKPNPATEKTAGKTPIDLNEIRIRPSETSFQFINSWTVVFFLFKARDVVWI